MESDLVWISICSKHQQEHADCPLCRTGYFTSSTELADDQELFRSDYAAWFRKHNESDE